MTVIDVTDSSFDEVVLQSDKPVLVDFWAPWCGPCRAVSPIVEQIAGEYEEKLRVVKVNVDDNPGLSERFNIASIPLLTVFSEGEVVKTVTGAKPKPALLAELDSFLQ